MLGIASFDESAAQGGPIQLSLLALRPQQGDELGFGHA
jgi:hypothetical protein